jgi:hypothetical protein
MGCEMSEDSFQVVPVPDRYVLRVYSCITEWNAEDQAAAEEEAGTAVDDEVPLSPDVDPWSPPELVIWPAQDLKFLSQDMTAKTPQIITKMLDFLALKPDVFHRTDVIGAEINVPAESVSAAFRKLNGYLGSRLGRTERPFVQASGAYAVTAAQAQAWTDVRNS